VEQCPSEGDTHSTSLLIEGPEDGGTGTYTVTAAGTDDSGDAVLYTFAADDGLGTLMTSGPQTSATAAFVLTEGLWTISVTVDDDLFCDDVADDAERSEELEVVFVPSLLSHWPFDGDLTDAAGTNDGVFFGGAAPEFVEGRDGEPAGAILFDGIDDYVQIPPAPELALSETFTLALWFRAERTDQFETYLLSRNDSIPGGSGKQYAIIYEYTDDHVDFFAPARLFGDDPRAEGASLIPLADTDWHHLAYTNDGATWAGYLDGEEFFSRELVFALDDTFSSSWWIGAARPTSNYVHGAFDEVRIYNYGLSGEEIAALVETTPETTLKRGDANVDGQLNIADAIFVLGYLFGNAETPSCEDAADCNDDGELNIADAIAALGHLFGGTGPLPDPFTVCGPDPTADDLGCEVFPPCAR
jgi:hypothetical protein